jgi:hypothetical protein
MPGDAEKQTAASFEVASMSKVLILSGMAVALLVAVVFALDLFIGVPFGRASKVMDIGFVVCGLLLFLLSWMTQREQV